MFFAQILHYGFVSCPENERRSRRFRTSKYWLEFSIPPRCRPIDDFSLLCLCYCVSHLLDLRIWAVCSDGLALLSLSAVVMAPDAHVTLHLAAPTLRAVAVPRTAVVHLHCTHMNTLKIYPHRRDSAFDNTCVKNTTALLFLIGKMTSALLKRHVWTQSGHAVISLWIQFFCAHAGPLLSSLLEQPILTSKSFIVGEGGKQNRWMLMRTGCLGFENIDAPLLARGNLTTMGKLTQGWSRFSLMLLSRAWRFYAWRRICVFGKDTFR